MNSGEGKQGGENDGKWEGGNEYNERGKAEKRERQSGMRRKEELGETQREEREWGGREEESKEGKKEMKKNRRDRGIQRERECGCGGEEVSMARIPLSNIPWHCNREVQQGESEFLLYLIYGILWVGSIFDWKLSPRFFFKAYIENTPVSLSLYLPIYTSITHT